MHTAQKQVFPFQEKPKLPQLMLGTRLDTVTPRHLLKHMGAGHTPFMSNVRPSRGILKKRNGYSTIWNFPDEIMGFHISKVKSSGESKWYAIIPCANGKIYEWDMDYGPTHADWDPPNVGIKDITGTVTVTAARADTSKAYFQFCDWYDRYLGHVVVMTNGIDVPIIYDKIAGSLYHLGTVMNSPQTGLSVAWQNETINSARFVGGMKGVLYFSYVDISGAPDAGTPNPFRTVWSAAADSRDFEFDLRYQDRPEDDEYIGGLIHHKGNLFLGKEDRQIYAIGAYSRYQNLESGYGFSSPWGQCSGDSLIYNSQGQVRTIDGQWLSEPIHNLFATDKISSWSEIRIIRDPYNGNIYASTGHRIWEFDVSIGSWFQYDYGNREVKVLGAIPPYMKFMYQWPGYVFQHEFVLAEYDIISDIILQIGTKTLVRQAPWYNDDGLDINFTYDFPWLDMGDPSKDKSWRTMMFLGEPDTGPFSLLGSFSDYPKMPEYNKNLGSLSFDSRGKAEFNYEHRYRLGTFRIFESSSNKFNVAMAFCSADIEQDV